MKKITNLKISFGVIISLPGDTSIGYCLELPTMLPQCSYLRMWKVQLLDTNQPNINLTQLRLRLDIIIN